MNTDKMTVLSMYPDAVAECFHDPDGRVVWAIWSIPKDMGTTTRCRYILGTGKNETHAWHNTSVGIEKARLLMEDVCSNRFS
jgi:hypothetical protein